MADIVARDLADAPQTVLQSAAVYRKRQGGGVVVTAAVMVKPAVTSETVEEIIEEAFKREAEVDARHIKVEVSDHTVKLYGHVHSLKEANAATAEAAAAPGIAKVESHLVVSP
jgi:osmotically-inducible protein OsmY